MKNYLDLSNLIEQTPVSLGKEFTATNPAGQTVSFNNCYMEWDGKPFYGITGEAHFSRIAEDQFEDTIIKMKLCGINMIATYVFWIVHEEQEGVFRFDGNRDLRKFITLCKKHGMYVILRVGPFDHGEMRNGGLPDWLYGKPFECRDDSEAYLFYVRRLYEQIHHQIDGLYFAQGGPIIGIQVENEYMHSSAPWEITTGISNEWVPGGTQGEQHLQTLKKLSKEVGMQAAFYTCTAWGGAATPDDMLPLWGGYSYWPWIFYNRQGGTHPATPEYIYRDNHNNAVPKTYNFEPKFLPESRPYACCEMMGGMFCAYQYRFVLPFESVDALANIKLGSGCNLLGYYMFRGGSTPKGEKAPFLNESQSPKISYDFQAAVGEFGQVRPSYHRLRVLHYFCQSYAGLLCKAKTAVPDWMEQLDPEDKETLRFCVRAAGDAGFVFLNNFQDHAAMADKQDECIALQLPGGALEFEHLSLAAGENAILPFGLQLGGAELRYATAQPITKATLDGGVYYFFFRPEGMQARYHWNKKTVCGVSGCEVKETEQELVCIPEQDKTSCIRVETARGAFHIVTLTRADSLKFYHLTVAGKDVVLLSDAPILQNGDRLTVEVADRPVTVCSFPQAVKLNVPQAQQTAAENSIFRGCTCTPAPGGASLPEPKRVGPSRYTLAIPAEALTGHKTVLLRVQYLGDIGHAFIDGDMISDNFANGEAWDIRLDADAERLKKSPLTLYITPLKEEAVVNVDSPMAARMEQVSGLKAELLGQQLVTVDEVELLV